VAAKPGSTPRAPQISKRDAGGGRPNRAKLKVTQVKSTISHVARNRATIRALGLHGIGSTSVVTDNPATRGMVRQVRFLVTVEEIAEAGSDPVAAQVSPGRGGDERVGERAPRVRERARGGANEGMSRIRGDQAADQEKV
jgi:large subunit ribosomal protein L30